MDYEKKYKEALKRAKEIKSKILYSHLSTESCKAVSEYIDTIIPELTESEDERIRKECISIIKHYGHICEEDGDPCCTINDCLAYLEKQKEIPFPDSTQLIEMWEQEKAVLKEKDFRGDEWRLAYNAFLDGFAKGCSVKKKEQKPVEWSDSFEENIRILLHDKLTWHSEDGSMSSTILIDDKTLKDIVNGIWFYVGKEALKYPNKELNATEWNEEDEIMIDNIEQFLSDPSLKKLAPNTEKQTLNWLKNLTERFNLQPKQEWSEEDEWKINVLIGVIKGILWNQDKKDEYISWLKSLRPQSHWKPSEEQMKALEKTTRLANFGTDAKRRDTLLSLYEQLKKL